MRCPVCGEGHEVFDCPLAAAGPGARRIAPDAVDWIFFAAASILLTTAVLLAAILFSGFG